MQAYFQSSLFAYLILLVMGVELLLLWAYHGITKKGIPPRQAMANIASGGAVVLAMGLLVEGVAWHWIALLLLISMIAHIWDVAHRWNASSGKPFGKQPELLVKQPEPFSKQPEPFVRKPEGFLKTNART